MSLPIGQLVESLLPIGIIFGLNALKLDYSDPNVLLGFRLVFASSVVIYLVACYLVQSKISANKAALDDVKFTHEKPMGFAEKMAAQSEYAQAQASNPNAVKPKETISVTETAFEYDMGQLKELAKSGLISYGTPYNKRISLIHIHMCPAYNPDYMISQICIFIDSSFVFLLI